VRSIIQNKVSISVDSNINIAEYPRPAACELIATQSPPTLHNSPIEGQRPQFADTPGSIDCELGHISERFRRPNCTQN